MKYSSTNSTTHMYMYLLRKREKDHLYSGSLSFYFKKYASKWRGWPMINSFARIGTISGIFRHSSYRWTSNIPSTSLDRWSIPISFSRSFLFPSSWLPRECVCTTRRTCACNLQLMSRGTKIVACSSVRRYTRMLRTSGNSQRRSTSVSDLSIARNTHRHYT